MPAETVMAWEPPPGMLKPVVASWRAFYRAALLTYSVTPKFYRQMYLAQSGRCYICRIAKGINPDDPNGGGSRRLGIDHNHLIGNRIEAVRGLLCTGSLSANTCNRLVARYDEAQLWRAVRLCTRPPAQFLLSWLELQGRTEPSDQDLRGLLT